MPPQVEVEQLCVGFLIAMPQQRPRTGLGNGSYSNLSASTSRETISDKWTDEYSPTDSRWDLRGGQLPELSVGISTVYVPIEGAAQEQHHETDRR